MDTGVWTHGAFDGPQLGANNLLVNTTWVCNSRATTYSIKFYHRFPESVMVAKISEIKVQSVTKHYHVKQIRHQVPCLLLP